MVYTFRDLLSAKLFRGKPKHYRQLMALNIAS